MTAYLMAAPWVVAVGAVIWAAVESGKRHGLMLELDDARDDSKELQGKLSNMLDVAERRSVNLARLRGEIRSLEVDLDACADPHVVKRSLRRMLSKDTSHRETYPGPVQPAADG